MKSEVKADEFKSAEASKVSSPPTTIDPTKCTVFPGNGRADTKFDPIANAALVDDIRKNGQITSVLVRPVSGGFEVIAGSRRLGAILEIRKTEPTRELKAFVAPLPDEKAWQIADKENANRRDLTPIQRARTWSYAINTFHGGSQKSFASAAGLQETTVSRTLRLLDIPPSILGALKNPEAVSVNFATELFKNFNSADELKRAEVIAGNLASQNSLRSPSALLDALCSTPAEIEGRKTRFLPFSGIDQHAAVKSKRDGGIVLTVKAIEPSLDNAKARKTLLKELHLELKKLIMPDTPGVAESEGEASPTAPTHD